MIKTFLGFILIVIIKCSSASQKNWCDINCQNGPHILCEFTPNDIPTEDSCGNILQSGLTGQDKRKILDAINSLRQKVASGNETRGNPGPQPKAEYMPNLVWDNQLADIAQMWANQCKYGHRCAHLGNSYSDYVGQNIGMMWQEPAGVYEDIVHNWFNEVKDFNKDHAKRFVPSKKNGPKIGHYTQTVWAKTTKVGCGGMKFIKKANDLPATYLVCNYHHAGNLPGAAVY